MIRKPTNLLLTTTLKRALVDLTAAESDIQLTFSQVILSSFKIKPKKKEFYLFSLFKFVSIHYI